MRNSLLAVAVVLGLCPGITSAAAPSSVSIEVLSSRADLVSGGDAVVGITIPATATISDLHVQLGATDVTNAFAVRPNGTIEGLVDGLQEGPNTLTATVAGAGA